LKAKDKGERFNAEVRNGERLLESTVENGIAGGVDEFREDHGVFVGERASVARKKCADGYGSEDENACERRFELWARRVRVTVNSGQ
jgi:hypothetical protein